MKRLDLLISCIIFTAVGGVAGWISSEQTHEDQAAHAHGADPAAGAVRGEPATPILSRTTLTNLGVEVGQITPRTFRRTKNVPARIVDRPTNSVPVFAPVGGRVITVEVAPGTVVDADGVLLTIIRDPIPRPVLTLTEDFLKPAEEIHEAVVSLRMGLEEISILQAELDRVTAFTGTTGSSDVPIIPRKTAIDLRYQLLRARKAHELAEHELEKHGFTRTQIEKIGKGHPLPTLGVDNWKRSLQRNGLWPESADKLHAALPTDLQSMPWALATVGELAAGGLISKELLDWFTSIPHDCEHFLDIGSLLQRGHSVDDIRALHALGALDPVVKVKAPSSAPDWDVTSLDVRRGAHVERGQQLLTLHAPRSMHLETEPVGSDKSEVLKALAGGVSCEAHPLVEGSGPVLKDLRLAFVTGRAGTAGTVAVAIVTNSPLSVAPPAGEAPRHRSWHLRAGLRYMLRIPVEEFTNVFVLPADAITTDGAREVVFVRKGLRFEPIEVELIHRDDRVAVIPINDRTRLTIDHHVAISGAYPLALTMKGRDRATSAHGHPH